MILSKKFIFYRLSILTLISILNSSCFDTLSTPTTSFSLRICDAPSINFKSFIIDIQAVQVYINSDSDASGWKTLDNTQVGPYDLMKLNNGVDSLLCSQSLPVGNINQIKLVLGTNNKVILNDGTVKPLYLLASQLSALKIKINVDLNSGSPFVLYLDIDVARSIRVDNSGTYFFFPSARTFDASTTGGVSGNLKPATVGSFVGLISGSDTIGCAISKNGFFFMRGIPSAENYKLVVLPLSDTTYLNCQMPNVQVEVGKVTEYTINLYKKFN